jgi:hypothetical protein
MQSSRRVLLDDEGIARFRVTSPFGSVVTPASLGAIRRDLISSPRMTVTVPSFG